MRFLGLGTWSLWLDEAFTLVDALHGEGAHNPVGYGLFGAFYELFPGRPSEAVLRAPAAVCGWLVLPATFLFLRPLAGAGPAGLGALFVALSTWHLYWSQNARFYTLAQLAALAGGALVLAGVQGGSVLRIVAGFLFVALGAAVHPSVALFGAALLLAPWCARGLGRLPAVPRPVWNVLALGLVAAVLLGAVWGLEVWERWELNKGGANPLHFVVTTGYLVTPLLGLAWGLGALRALAGGRAGITLVTLATVLTLALGLGFSFLSRMSGQYVFVLLPWLAVGAAYGVAGLRPLPRAALAVLVALPLAVESGLYHFVRHGDRPRWKEAFEHVFAARGELDLVLAMEAPVGEYYLDPQKTRLREWRSVTWLDRFRPSVHERWLRYPRPIWFVVNLEQQEDWAREDARAVRRFLGEECELVAEYPVPWTPRDLDVFVYRWPGAP